MQNSNCSPDHCTFSSLMHACAESFEFLYGCVVHAFIVKTGWNVAVEVKNSILSFYAKLGCQTEAMEEIESIGTLTQVSWNAIIDAHMKMGDIHEAFNVFQKAPDKNVVSWTSMIAGYARSGAAEQALTFFVDMIKSGVLPDDFTFGAALYACSSLAVLGLGRMVHACVVQNGFLVHAYVGNGLINMYAKCGDIEGSSWAFHDILDKDLVSWNAMLFGFGMHGLTTQALQLYEDVVASGVKPDRVTFIGLLMTCSHSGLIEKGKAFFKLMETVYKLPHEADHVACMVDMLGRGGYLAEAKELTKRYSLAGNARATSCEVLLGACSAHGDVKTGTYIGEDLKILEPDREMSYVLLSNLYCASEQWNEAEMIRKSMVDQGIKKMPGCSWIELRNKVTTFVAGNTSHIYTEELSNILCCLDFQIRNQCYSGFKK
ncbi:pentatricopeptide repeat-containing protein At2g36980, mitochondrial [Carica papaya]|uniref:pentatricopeptide repeat-containing protein At2g36980, mitochondrial n=1 Tax=Carica papaya TaxID=3649 RepID=UPI000B8D1166|nr:pentatricopeptide repeat-containing protein At2g36980, mitochondrial [Carica papaya]